MTLSSDVGTAEPNALVEGSHEPNESLEGKQKT